MWILLSLFFFFLPCVPLQVQTRNIRCLPDVLVINCEVNSAKEAEFWKVQAEVIQHCDEFLSCLSKLWVRKAEQCFCSLAVCFQQGEAEGGDGTCKSKRAATHAHRVVFGVRSVSQYQTFRLFTSSNVDQNLMVETKSLANWNFKIYLSTGCLELTWLHWNKLY